MTNAMTDCNKKIFFLWYILCNAVSLSSHIVLVFTLSPFTLPKNNFLFSLLSLFKEEKMYMGTGESFGKQWQEGDVIGVLLDLIDKTISKLSNLHPQT